MNIIRRKDALTKGLLRYYTGKPCKRGHITERRIDGGCIICCKTRQQNNLDKCAAASRKWRGNNPGKQSAMSKRWDDNNPGNKSARRQKYNTSKIHRTPVWMTMDELERIKIVYEIAANMSKLDGIQYDVDHIIPLRGRNKSVSGLHILSNLQIITHQKNMEKGNIYND